MGMKYNPISGQFDMTGDDSKWKNETGAYTALTQKTPGPIFASVGTVDTTPFTVGGFSPGVNFDADFGGAALNIVGISSHGSGGFFDLGSLMFFNRSRGTQAAPTAMQTGDYIGGLVFGGYGAGDYNLALTGLLVKSDADWDVTQTSLLQWVMGATTAFELQFLFHS